MGLEVAGSGGIGKLTDIETQQATDTVLAALHLGHVLLELGGSTPRYPKPTKEFLAQLAAGGGTLLHYYPSNRSFQLLAMPCMCVGLDKQTYPLARCQHSKMTVQVGTCQCQRSPANS